VSSKIIMRTSVTRLCFTTQHQTCKTKTTACKTKPRPIFLVSDLCCPKIDGLRPHHSPRKTKICTEVSHVTRDSQTTFRVKRSKVNLRRQGHIVAASCRACLSGIWRYLYIVNHRHKTPASQKQAGRSSQRLASSYHNSLELVDDGLVA